jgi:hypothetical protein
MFNLWIGSPEVPGSRLSTVASAGEGSTGMARIWAKLHAVATAATYRCNRMPAKSYEYDERSDIKSWRGWCRVRDDRGLRSVSRQWNGR